MFPGVHAAGPGCGGIEATEIAKVHFFARRAAVRGATGRWPGNSEQPVGGCPFTISWKSPIAQSRSSALGGSGSQRTG